MPSDYVKSLIDDVFKGFKKSGQGTTAEAPEHDRLEPEYKASPDERLVYHVTPRAIDGRWNIKRETADYPTAIEDRKDDAVSKAKEIAKRHTWSQVVIHYKDGKIAEEFKYGGPPEDPNKRTKSSRKTKVSKRTRSLDNERVVYHVTPRKDDGKWNVKREGAERATEVIDLKEDAIQTAKEYAKKHSWSQVIIHNKNGKIAEEFKYGGPPEEKKAESNSTKKGSNGSKPQSSGERVVYHVTPRKDDGKWNVKREGAERATEVIDLKEDAIQTAKEYAKKHSWSQVIIHNKNGKIAEEFKYGGPPEEKKAESNSTKKGSNGSKPQSSGERVVYHVTPRKDDGKWNVKREGAERATEVIDLKEDAIQTAKEYAKKHSWSQVIIHNKDGKIAEEFKYGGPPS